MFDYKLLLLAPKLMGISEKVLKVVRGEGEPGEVRIIIAELKGLLEEIPQLKGFLLLLEPIFAIIDKVGTEIFAKPGLLTDEEIMAGKALVEILGPVLKDLEREMADAAAAVELKDVDRLT